MYSVSHNHPLFSLKPLNVAYATRSDVRNSRLNVFCMGVFS